MEQYKKSGPGTTVKKESDTRSIEDRLHRIEDEHIHQQEIIVELQTEIRRLKAKLDRHADHINRQQRG